MLKVVFAGPTRAVQLDRGFDNSLPGLGLLPGPALQGIGPCHLNFHCTPCVINIDHSGFIIHYIVH